MKEKMLKQWKQITMLALAIFLTMGAVQTVKAANTPTFGYIGSLQMEQAQEIDLGTAYSMDYLAAGYARYFKFKTDEKVGAYVFSFKNEHTYAGCDVSLLDQYSNVIRSGSLKQKNMGRPEYCTIGCDEYQKVQLKPNTYYYLRIEPKLLSWSYADGKKGTISFHAQFIPFKGPNNVKVTPMKNNEYLVTWDNKNAYNTYSSLASYSYFNVYVNSNNQCFEYTSDMSFWAVDGNGGANSKVIKYELKKDMFLWVVGTQTVYNYFNNGEKIGICAKSAPIQLFAVRLKQKVTSGNLKYEVTKVATNGEGTVKVTGLVKKRVKTVTIPESIEICGGKYKVTTIAANAFKKNTKITKVKIGKSVQNIEKNAFAGCKNLKSVDIKAVDLKKVGKAAFKGMSKKGVIINPSNKTKKYKKLLKGKYTKGVRVV